MTATEVVTSTTFGDKIGRVKWFNSRLGYGFITVDEEDIFAHQSKVVPSVSQYRTLYQGEYVSLNVNTSGETRQATDITGVNGGPLLCDNRAMAQNNDEESGEGGGDGGGDGGQCAGDEC